MSRADDPALRAFNEHQRLKNLAPTTIAQRARVVGSFATWLRRPLVDARARDLRAYFASRRDALSNGSQATAISILKTFYSALVELGLLDKNPAASLKSWRPPLTRQPMSLVVVRALLLEAGRPHCETPLARALALRDRAVLELLFATGMRRSEVSATCVVDVDLEGGSVLVRRAKRGRGRRLPLPAACVEALRGYLSPSGRAVLLRSRSDPGRLFLTKCGTSLGRGLLDVVRKVGARAGVHVFPHLFRRTLATELARAGVSLPVIQDLLGHSRPSTTSDYVAVALEDMRQALDLFAGQLPRRRSGPLTAVALQCRLFSESQLSAA